MILNEKDIKMEPRDFVYWLQGFMEIQKPETLNAEQVQEIKNHLGLVFNKITPTVPKLLDEVKTYNPYFCKK